MAQRQDPDAGPAFVDRQEGASLDVLSVCLEWVGDNAHGSIGQQILSAELDDARPTDGTRGEDCREVQIVGDKDKRVVVGRRHVWQPGVTVPIVNHSGPPAPSLLQSRILVVSIWTSTISAMPRAEEL